MRWEGRFVSLVYHIGHTKFMPNSIAPHQRNGDKNKIRRNTAARAVTMRAAMLMENGSIMSLSVAYCVTIM